VITQLDSIVSKLIRQEGVEAEKITILINREIQNSVLNMLESVGGYSITTETTDRKNDIILVQKVEDYKGLESDIVIYINHTYKNAPFVPEVQALQYTALTRARFYLYVINYEESI